MISLAASAAQDGQSPGLFMLAWGLTASAFGLAAATNFRGFADNFARRAEASSAGLRKLPPWRWQQPRKPGEAAKLVRLVAIPFAIIGPIVTVAGITSISHGRTGTSGPTASPGPSGYLFIAGAIAAVAWSWLSPRGWLRPAARRGGWRLAVALLSSLGALICGISIAIGQMTIGIVALFAGGLPALALLAEDKPTGTGPDDARDPEGHNQDPSGPGGPVA